MYTLMYTVMVHIASNIDKLSNQVDDFYSVSSILNIGSVEKKCKFQLEGFNMTC